LIISTAGFFKIIEKNVIANTAATNSTEVTRIRNPNWKHFVLLVQILKQRFP